MVSKMVARTRRRRASWSGAIAAGGALFVCARADAQPLRLRADAIAEARAPAGLVVLQGADGVRPWLDAEGLVWAGARSDATADVLVLSFRAREPHGYAELRGGRFLFATGAIRPLHVDGASAIARAPWGSKIEAMAGAPVTPSFGARAYDWVVAGRASQSIASRATLGFSYVHQRAHGEVANEELGADLAALPAPWLDLAARAAYDLVSPGIADALVSAAARSSPFRVEAFASHRSPSRLLPATSLFSVLGDFPSQMIGTTVRWDAAPRLDLLASGAGQAVGGALGGNAWLRAQLRLDDRGDGALGLELRRQDVSTARWSGVRGTASHPLGAAFRVSSEIEIAVPDEPRGRGIVWPWGLLALAWRRSGWEVAAAAEVASTPTHRYEVDALLRVARVMELP
jgi:hypothetical protein